VAGGVFYTDYELDQDRYKKDDFLTRELTTKVGSSEIGGISRVTMDLGERDSLAVGGQVRGDSADISNTVRGTLSQPDLTIGSAAVENVYAATERITFVAGLSYDLLTGGGATTRSQANPQGVVSVDFGSWGATRLAIGRKIRFPTLRELFDPQQGNAALGPEKTVTYEIGHHIELPWGAVALNLFRSEVDDLIETGGGGEPGRFRNIQSATLRGIEVSGGVTPLARVRLDVNYTYLDTTARDQTILGSDASAIQHKPAHRFNGVLQVFLPWRLLFRSEGLYTADQLDQFGSVVVVPGFGVWNVQLIRPVGNWLSVFAGADNLLDADYEQKLGTPEPGRRVFAGFRAAY
jgi:outer membrane receptor protein involved in Fe transport